MARLSSILDRNGSPIRVEDLKRDIAGPSITGVRSPISGDPASGLTPDRLAAILRQAEEGNPLAYFELAERIEERDPHYASVLGTRKRSVAQVDISVEAASESAEHQAHAEMIRAWLKRDELQDETVDILDAIGKGMSTTEIIWDTSAGQWNPSRLEWRDARWFIPDRADGSTPLVREMGGDVPLSAYKFIHHRFRAKSGLPIRGGITRIACWAWMFKAFTQRDWTIFTQTYGMPIRVGKYGAGASEADKEKLYQAVVNIASDCAAIMPDSMMVEFIEAKSGATSTDHYERRSDWLDRQMSKVVLGQTTTTDAVSGGHAVSKEHRKVQEDIERADAKGLSASLNRDLVKPWVDLEFGVQKAYPRLVIARPEERDVKMIMDGVERGVAMGLKVPKSYLHDLLGVPDAAAGEELLEAPRAPAKMEKSKSEPKAEDPPLTELNAAGDMAVPRDAIDDQAAALADNWQPLIVPAVTQVQALMDSCTDLKEFLQRLPELAVSIDTAELAKALADAATVARIAGLAGAPLSDGSGTA